MSVLKIIGMAMMGSVGEYLSLYRLAGEKRNNMINEVLRPKGCISL